MTQGCPRQCRAPPATCAVAEVLDNSQKGALRVISLGPQLSSGLLVFMIREPFSTVISAYGYHLSGRECKRSSGSKWGVGAELKAFCAAISPPATIAYVKYE